MLITKANFSKVYHWKTQVGTFQWQMFI